MSSNTQGVSTSKCLLKVQALSNLNFGKTGLQSEEGEKNPGKSFERVQHRSVSRNYEMKNPQFSVNERISVLV